MDPNATLRAWAAAVESQDLEEAAEYHGYLSDWLRRGGFEPAWGQGAASRSRFFAAEES
jgi:hypothetical protein